MNDYYEPVYKGCTSPSTIAGVPTLPFVLSAVVFAQLGLVAFMTTGAAGILTVAVIYGYVLRWARRVSRSDDHRLEQMIKRLKIRHGHRLSTRYWGAGTYGAARTKGQR